MTNCMEKFLNQKWVINNSELGCKKLFKLHLILHLKYKQDKHDG